ncbi:MAG: patatin-like phospholipase family protein [Rhodospirillales bacterium]|nr:patatin-like phospholipase family protein [Alphaproteobacteria bacterium]MCB1840785.1 patatin-like phospholipase family protein [Alphaproteobacteria bacterium]MCB9976532.1 patatin-like phospholipase family protein [Rhodospirillales bacterium]
MSIVPLLSVDGGGIRGIIPSRILEYVETRMGVPVQSRFYMSAGASAGGQIVTATSLVNGKPILTAGETKNLFVVEGPEIFRKGFLSRTFNIDLPNLFTTKYDGKHLDHVLRRVFGDLKLSDLDNDLLVSSYDIVRRKEKLFKSWDARGNFTDPSDRAQGTDPRSKDYSLFDVARATSSAQSYFNVYTAHNMLGEPSHLIDGGNFANNPALMLYADAVRRYGDTHQYVVLSLGSGETERPLDVHALRNAGIIRWASPTVHINLGSMRSHDYIMRTLLERDYIRMQTDLRRQSPDKPGPSDDFDDASKENIARLEERAEELLKAERHRLDCFVEFLMANKLKTQDELADEHEHCERSSPRPKPACDPSTLPEPEGTI